MKQVFVVLILTTTGLANTQDHSDAALQLALSAQSQRQAAAPTHVSPEATPADPLATTTPNPVLSPSLATQTDRLSDEEVRQALAGDGRGHWTFIEDMAFGAQSWNQSRRLELYLPEAAIWIASRRASKQDADYQPTEEDRERALTVVARGLVGDTVSEGCDSIKRVVIVSDPTGRVKAQAYRTEPIESTWGNAYGATNSCQDLRAKFWLEDVKKVRSAADKGEFYITVFAGSSHAKTYKIKLKFQTALGWNYMEGRSLSAAFIQEGQPEQQVPQVKQQVPQQSPESLPTTKPPLTSVRKLYFTGYKKLGHPNFVLSDTCLSPVDTLQDADAIVDLENATTPEGRMIPHWLSSVRMFAKDGKTVLWSYNEGERHENNGVWNIWSQQLNLAVGCGHPRKNYKKAK